MRRSFASLTLAWALAVAAASACSRAQPQEQSSEIKAGLAALANVPYSPARVLTTSDIDALPTTWTLPVPFPLQRIWRLNDGGLLLYCGNWSESIRSVDQEGNSGVGDNVVIAIDSDGRERWRYALGWWKVYEVAQSMNASLLTLKVSTDEGGVTTIVIDGEGRERFRMGTQFRVWLEPSPDGTHLVRMSSFTRRTRFPLVRGDSEAEVEWGKNVLIGLDGEALSDNLTLDYSTHSRPVCVLVLEREEAIIVDLRDPSASGSRIELWMLDGTIKWTIPDADVRRVFTTGEWEARPTAFIEQRQGDSWKTVSVSVHDGSTIASTQHLNPQAIVAGHDRVAITEIEHFADPSSCALLLFDQGFTALGWGRLRSRQAFRNLDGADGVAWAQNSGIQNGERTLLSISEIFDFRVCNAAAGIGTTSSPLRPTVLEGTWAVIATKGDELSLIGQARPEEAVRRIQLDLSK